MISTILTRLAMVFLVTAALAVFLLTMASGLNHAFGYNNEAARWFEIGNTIAAIPYALLALAWVFRGGSGRSAPQ